MKQIIILLGVVLIFTSCKKATETLTLLGEWQIDSYQENGVDQTTMFKATYQNYLVKYDASKNYIETYTKSGIYYTNAGPWKLTNGGDDFELINQADNSKRYFHIVELNPSSSTITENDGIKSYNLRKIK